MTAARITAIIPTFNSRRYIRDTVESVLTQTYPVHEVIVVDDGSTDGTEQALARYAGRIRYIRQQNAGPPAARNNGLGARNGGLGCLARLRRSVGSDEDRAADGVSGGSPRLRAGLYRHVDIR